MAAGWRQYQQEVAEAFQAIGFEATVEETLAGARASHDVDVVVRLKIAGVEVLWVVECKLWKTSVGKEQVMTLVGIAQDVGADRAFLLSESGFQAGALTAVRHTNVTLTDLKGLIEAANEDVHRRLLGELVSEKVRLEHRIRDHLFDAHGQSPGLKVADLDEVTTLLGACFDIGLALSKVVFECYPVRLSALLDDSDRVFGKVGDLVAALRRDLTEVSDRVDKLDAATRVRRGQVSEQALRLAAEIEDLIEAGDAVFAVRFDDPARDVRLLECLTSVRAIGDLIEDLRPFLGPELFAQVRALRQCLIDGAYLVLASPEADSGAWRFHAEIARQSAADLRSALATMEAPDDRR